MALKQKLALARKTKAVNTLQEELTRTEDVRDRLEEMADGMTVPLGETTVGHLRSASWYGNQVQDQLKPHQQDRVKALVAQIEGADRYRRNIGYQGYKAMTLVGAGGLTGVGRDQAETLIRFNHLPEEHKT